eukprot:769972-Prymnesium_polylepis.1
MGPCSANWKRSWSDGSPRSAGFSIAKSAPTRWAASNRTQSRLLGGVRKLGSWPVAVSRIYPGRQHALEFSKIMNVTPADLRRQPTNVYTGLQKRAFTAMAP